MQKFLGKTTDEKYKVRVYGKNFLYTKEEFVKEVKNGNMYFKANKLVEEKDVR